MQDGPKPLMSARQPRPAASFAARSKRWRPGAARPESERFQNAQRNYERYLALISPRRSPNRQHGRGRELLPVRRTLF
jgi:Ni/Co efflux regulator RcnB